MKISANGIDVAEVQAQQLAADQAVVAAQTANIRKGVSVLDQTGIYTQLVELFGRDTASRLEDIEANSLIFDQIDYDLTLQSCRANYLYLGFLDASWPQMYWGAIALDCEFQSLQLAIDASMVDGLLWIGLSDVGATTAYIGGAIYGDYNFSLYLSDNAIPVGTDADDGASGTVCGIINQCYSGFYLGGALNSHLYLTGENMGALEAGMHDGTIANAEEMALAGWTVDYEIYIEEMP